LGWAGEDGIERQAQLADHRRLPQHAVLAGSVLTQVEVSGPDLVRAAWERHQQHRQGHEDREPPHGRTSTWLARDPSLGSTEGSTTIWYFRIRFCRSCARAVSCRSRRHSSARWSRTSANGRTWGGDNAVTFTRCNPY